MTRQPQILALCDTILAAKELFLLCEDVLYEVDFLTRFNKICHPSQRPRWQVDKEAIGLSRVQFLVKAVDICFKVFFIVNAEYPAEAADVWTFVQKGLFNITTPYDVVTPREMELLGHIKC